VSEDEDPTELNTVVFRLYVRCGGTGKSASAAAAAAADDGRLVVEHTVHSRALQWVPQVSQATAFADQPIRPVHDTIQLAELRPGQEIDMELHCIKGVGREHAKWSPVCTPSLPHPRRAPPAQGSQGGHGVCVCVCVCV
jgi:DNA-directed RNA polymerases I and III subunit RPAC1